MLDAMYLASSGLSAFSQGLRTVSHNVSNMNTTGFRGFETQFTNIASRDAGLGSDLSGQFSGGGVATLPDTLNLRSGALQSTGAATDVAVDGNGFFLLRNEQGELRLTRDGHFSMKDYKLVAADGSTVQSFADGKPVDLDISSSLSNPAKRTNAVTFLSGGILVLGRGAYNAPNVNVFDSAGGSYVLSMRFEQVADTNPDDGITLNEWSVTVTENATGVEGSPFTIRFDANGNIDDASKIQMVKLKPAGQDPQDIKIDLTGVISNSNNTSSSRLQPKADGNAVGQLVESTLSFDDTGTLQMRYSNGQTVAGPQLALALISDATAIEQLEQAQFRLTRDDGFRFGVSGTDFGTIASGQLEGSNVELTEEFSQLIIMQRGYQASSEIITTANEMIATLLRMKSGGG
jgi:flagellar hook protein FlgE